MIFHPSQVPRLHSLKPSRGPVSGGTIVNITGSNLDSGSNVSIMFKDQKCTYHRYSGPKKGPINSVQGRRTGRQHHKTAGADR